MQMIVINVLPQRLGHSPVSLVGVHDCGENVLLTTDDFHGGFIGVSVEFFGEVISSVIIEVGGIDIEDQLTELCGVRLESPGGYDLLLLQLQEHFFIGGGRLLKMDVIDCTFRHNIRVGIDFFLPFVVGLCAINRGTLFQIAVSCNGAIHPVVSRQRHDLLASFFRFSCRQVLGSTSAEV